MSGARIGSRYPSSIKAQAVRLRRIGRTHREIAASLNISISTAYLWSKAIAVTQEQKRSIEARRNQHHFSDAEQVVVQRRLAPYQFTEKYSDTDLLERIQNFYRDNGRIPLKREFNAWDIYAARFGSWNAAIRKAGFEANPELFAKKFTANDGHACDSFTEKVIDDWLSAHGLAHERSVPYPGTRFTADFQLRPDLVLEFFGLAGVQKEYDKNIKKKRGLAHKLGYRLIEVYPADVYPTNRLGKLLIDAGLLVQS